LALRQEPPWELLLAEAKEQPLELLRAVLLDFSWL